MAAPLSRSSVLAFAAASLVACGSTSADCTDSGRVTAYEDGGLPSGPAGELPRGECARLCATEERLIERCRRLSDDRGGALPFIECVVRLGCR